MKFRLLVLVFLMSLFKLGYTANLIGTEFSLTTLAQATVSSEKFYTSFESFAVVSDSTVEYPHVADLNNPAAGRPPGFAGTLVDNAIDVDADTIEIDFSNSRPYSRFASGYQNTYIFTFDSDVGLSISGAEIDTHVTTLALDESDVTVEGNQVFINVDGLSFNTDTFVRINLKFDESGSLSIRDSDAPNFDRQITFGSVELTTISDHFVTLGNAGTTDIALADFAEQNALTSPFSFSRDSCSNQVLTPGATCVLAIQFSPTTAGDFSDSFVVTSNNVDATTVELFGKGVESPVADIYVLDTIVPVDDLQIAFGGIGQASISTQIITVNNEGSADLVIGNIANANSLLSPFTITSDACSNKSLIPGASCEFSVQFEPTDIGSFSDTFDVPSNDPDEPFTVLSVSGSGVLFTPASDIEVTDTVAPTDDLIVEFGEVEALESITESLVVSNIGGASLVLGAIAQVEQLSSPFELVSDECSNVVLQAGQSCSLLLRFTPETAGVSYQGSFDIPSSDEDEPVLTISLLGSGAVSDTDDSANNDDVVVSSGSSGGGSISLYSLMIFSLLALMQHCRLSLALRCSDSHK